MELKQHDPELNGEQQAAAFCTENAVVAAGAGSGKTMVLASRYAWLVTEKKYQVDEILTLTFTKKAAAQMYRRIYSLLGAIASADSETKPADHARLAAQALDNFIHARIQTLDSYCASLVKQAAPRYGISPDFTIDETRCWDLALEEALPFLIAHRHHPAIERLYPQKGPEAIARILFASAIFKYGYIDKPSAFIDDLNAQFAIVCAEWENQCDTIRSMLQELANLIAGDKDLLPDLVPLIHRFSSGSVEFVDSAEIREYFDFLLSRSDHITAAESHPVQSSIAELLEFIAELNALDLRRGRRSNNRAKEIINRFRKPVFGVFSSLAVFCMQAGLIISIISLLSDLQKRYLHKKRAERILTFTDVARLARTILLEQADIRQSEKKTFKAIMIDEFQDNNELQKDLLFLLAEKPELVSGDIPAANDLSAGKLFFVGDEKQSIYRFRGADVSVFRKLKAELGSAELPLKINYRSAPLLIGAFNAIFGGSDFDPEGKKPLSERSAVFASAGEDAELPLYEAAYSSLRAGREGEGKLTICVLDKKSGGASDDKDADRSKRRLSAVENEARFVAERIQRLLQEKNGAGEPKYVPGDIALLFRARGPQYLFERHLRLLNIPYAGEDLNGFFFGGAVNDVMSVLRLAAYPLDTAAYAEMLRSPFAGLSLRGLSNCIAIFNKPEITGPFTDDPIPFLDRKDRIKYQWGQQIYNLICAKACLENISSLVSDLWFDQGYRYETEWNLQTSVYGELYDYLFYLAARADADNRSLAAFTDSIQSLRDSDERLTDIEIPLERPGAVRLLTVHKSKGLEFPVVFLCCCDRQSQRSGGGGDICDTGGTGIAINPPLPARCAAVPNVRRNFFWEYSLAEEKRKKTAELRRLLYVGMTRAEKELYLAGCLDTGTGDDFSLCLKEFVNEKLEKAAGKNTIPGDTVLDNDTFFGLCLPALAGHISPGGLAAESSFFQVVEIPSYTESYIADQENRGALLPNNQRGLNAFFEKAEPFYRAVEIIHTPELSGKRVTPVSLGTDTTAIFGVPFSVRRFTINKAFSGENSSDIFSQVDAMLARFTDQDSPRGEKFNSGGFGTIAHACVEALLNGVEAAIPANLAGFLNPGEAAAFLAAGRELALRFVRSPLGKTAGTAKQRKSEFTFRSMVQNASGEEVFISGTIDLLFEDKQEFQVVDFKTDSQENPLIHMAQMACYYQAVSTLFAIPARKTCRIWLYYLRTGHAVEMTEDVKDLFLNTPGGSAPRQNGETCAKDARNL